MIYATEALVKIEQVFKANGYSIKTSKTNANQALVIVSKEGLDLRLGFSAKDQQFKLITSEGTYSYGNMGDFEHHVKKYTWLNNVFLKQARPIALSFSQILGISIIYDTMKSTKSTAFAYFRVLGDQTRSIQVIKKIDNDYFIVRQLQGTEPKVEVRYSSDDNLIYNDNTYHFLLEQTYGSDDSINIKHIKGTEYLYEYDGFSFKSSTSFTDSHLLTYDIIEINGKAETMSLTVSNLDIPALIKSIKEHLEMKVESMNVQKLDFLDDTNNASEDSDFDHVSDSSSFDAVSDNINFDDVLDGEEPILDFEDEPSNTEQTDDNTESSNKEPNKGSIKPTQEEPVKGSTEPTKDEPVNGNNEPVKGSKELVWNNEEPPIVKFDLESYVEPELSKKFKETENNPRVLKEAVALTYEGIIRSVRFIYSDDEFYDIPVDQLSGFPYDMLEHSLEYRSVKGMLLTETEIEHRRFAKRYTGNLQDLIDDFWRI